MSQRSRPHRPSLVPVVTASTENGGGLSVEGASPRRASSAPPGSTPNHLNNANHHPNVTLRTHLRDPGPARCFGFLGTIVGVCLLVAGIVVTTVASMLRAHRGLPKVDANIIQYTFISLVGFFITISSSILYSSANKVKRRMDAESQAAGTHGQKDSNASLSGNSISHSNDNTTNPQIVITGGDADGRTPGGDSSALSTSQTGGLTNSTSNTPSEFDRCSSFASVGSGGTRGCARRGSSASGGNRRSSRSPRASPARSPRQSPQNSPTFRRRSSSRRRRSNTTTTSTSTTTTTTDGSLCSGPAGASNRVASHGRRQTGMASAVTRPDLTVPDPEEFLGMNSSTSSSHQPTPSPSLPSYDAALTFPAPCQPSPGVSPGRRPLERRRSDGCRHNECRQAATESPPPPPYDVAVRNSHQIIESGRHSPAVFDLRVFQSENPNFFRVIPPSPQASRPCSRPSTPIPPSISLPSISPSSSTQHESETALNCINEGSTMVKISFDA